MKDKFKEFTKNPWFWFFTCVVVILLVLCCVTLSCKRHFVEVRYKVGDKWDKLMLVLDQIEKNYVDTVSYGDLTEKALPYILESLDPHSVYLPPQDLVKADETLSGNFSGIGIEFNTPNDTAIVINVIPGGPSAKVGIQSGDRIVKVDDRDVAGVKINQDTLISLLRGPVGSKVNVEVKRLEVDGPLSFNIKRDIIPDKCVDAAIMLNDTTGYIKLSKFSRTTYLEFIQALAKLQGTNRVTTLMLDLRDNPGGYMDQACVLANEFLSKGDLIVYMEGQARPREDYKANGRGRCRNLKLYVAINENSASSSEIFAGAIQDNDCGIIIGRRSFGKGVVQEPIYFSDRSGIRLTVARFYTPSGRCIQKPFSSNYMTDVFERYKSGELMSADSIRTNDSLVFKTVKGRTVYGGGGIIPDIFVPLDTTGASNFWMEALRKSLTLKFSSEFADAHRAELSTIKTLPALEEMFRVIPLKEQFLSFAERNGVECSEEDWSASGELIMLQLKGLIGRYSALDEDAYYAYVLKADKVVLEMLQNESNGGNGI